MSFISFFFFLAGTFFFDPQALSYTDTCRRFTYPRSVFLHQEAITCLDSSESALFAQVREPEGKAFGPQISVQVKGIANEGNSYFSEASFDVSAQFGRLEGEGKGDCVFGDAYSTAQKLTLEFAGPYHYALPRTSLFPPAGSPSSCLLVQVRVDAPNTTVHSYGIIGVIVRDNYDVG